MPLNDNIGLLVLGRWQINARTELALRYNDISPLENHHCSVAFNILEDPTANIFRLMDRDTFKSVREGMIRCILATDMARHNEIVNQLFSKFSRLRCGRDHVSTRLGRGAPLN